MKRRENDQDGFSLIEVIITLSITSLILGAATLAFLSQSNHHESQRMVSSLNQAGRMAMTVLQGQIRLARAGADPETSLMDACACLIRFQGNQSGTKTFLTTASAGPDLPIESAAGYSVGETVFVTDWTRWVSRTLTQIQSNPPLLRINAPLPSSFSRGSGVFQSALTTFELDPNNKKLSRNGQILVDHVLISEDKPLFRYFKKDNAELLPAGSGTCMEKCLVPSDRSQVRKVVISMEIETPRATNNVTAEKSTLNLQADALLRHPVP